MSEWQHVKMSEWQHVRMSEWHVCECLSGNICDCLIGRTLRCMTKISRGYNPGSVGVSSNSGVGAGEWLATVMIVRAAVSPGLCIYDGRHPVDVDCWCNISSRCGWMNTSMLFFFFFLISS